MSPPWSPKGMAGLMRILLLVSTNQISAYRFSSGINYLSHQFGVWPVIADDVELINGMRENFRDNLDRNFKKSQRETPERFVNGQDMSTSQLTICMNLWVPKHQITKSTKSQIKLNTELKRQNSQANRSILFYKDSQTSLWRSQAKLIFKWAKSWGYKLTSKTYVTNYRVST